MMSDYVSVRKETIGGLSANVKRWHNRARSVDQKRKRWRLRALEAEGLVVVLGEHLTALCNHPENYERRYDVANGAPCAGCYDARDDYALWMEEHNARLRSSSTPKGTP